MLLRSLLVLLAYRSLAFAATPAQAQQVQLAENQAKIEEKLADVAETIRTARIYTKREK